MKYLGHLLREWNANTLLALPFCCCDYAGHHHCHDRRHQ